jgi:hypothetical protein
MARKQRTDTVKGALSAMAGATAKPLDPPAHIKLRSQDKPYWNSIVSARARDRWNDADLEIAGNLARCKSDIERLQKEIDKEGDIITNERGTPIVNPRHNLLEVLSRRSVALSRMLQVHAEATQGKSRDQVKTNKAQEKAANAINQFSTDDLIARPH